MSLFFFSFWKTSYHLWKTWAAKTSVIVDFLVFHTSSSNWWVCIHFWILLHCWCWLCRCIACIPSSWEICQGLPFHSASHRRKISLSLKICFFYTPKITQWGKLIFSTGIAKKEWMMNRSIKVDLLVKFKFPFCFTAS